MKIITYFVFILAFQSILSMEKDDSDDVGSAVNEASMLSFLNMSKEERNKGTIRITSLSDPHCIDLILISKNKKFVVAGIQGNRTIVAINIDSGKIIRSISLEDNLIISHIALSTDDQYIAISTGSQGCICKIETGERVPVIFSSYSNKEIMAHDNHFFCISQSYFKQPMGDIRLTNMQTQELLYTIPTAGTYAAISADMKYFAFTYYLNPVNNQPYTDGLRLVDITTGNNVCSFDTGGRVSKVCISSDKSFLVVGYQDGTIKIWDIENAKCLHSLEGHSFGALQGRPHGIINMLISKDNKLLVTTSIDNTVRVWNTETGELLTCLNKEKHLDFSDSMLGIALSDDNNIVVTGSLLQDIKIWDLKTGVCLKSYDFEERLTISDLLMFMKQCTIL